MKLYSIFSYTFLFLSILMNCTTSRQIPGDLADTYYGFLPCADCPGISYTLELQKNGHYNLIMDYYDRESTFTSEGKFTYKNNKINLYTDHKITSQFEREGDMLIYLDGDGNRIQSNLAPYYNLYKADPSKAEMPDDFGGENSQLMYKGTGNEPFWLVQVTTQNTLKFKGLMENGEIEWEVPITGTRMSDDNQTIIYTGKEGSNALEVSIHNKPCQDDMSGFDFSTTLEVHLSTSDLNQNLRGCGEYLNKYQLNGTWRLEKINGRAISLPAPTLGIYFSEGRIAGSGGCNRYFGTLDEATNTSIKFNKLGATKMACEDMSLENQYLELLNQNDIQWKINDDGLLILSSNVGNFVFGRTEQL